MIISQVGVDLIKGFEGVILHTYIDAVGVKTIGYGHTGSDAYSGRVITMAQAEAFLKQDLGAFEHAVNDAVKVSINQNQFDSLVSFSFNVGKGALQSSTLLRKLNSRDYNGAASEFLKWNKGGGRVLAGLTRRRQAERDLFLKPSYTPSNPAPAPATPSIPPTTPVTSIPKAPSPFTPRQVFHKVQAGDTIAILSRRYGSTQVDIAKWNSLNSKYQIDIGQILRVK